MKTNAHNFLFGFFVAVILVAFIYTSLLVQNASQMYLGSDNAEIAQVERTPYSLIINILGKNAEIPVEYLKSAQRLLEEHYTLIPASVRLFWQLKSIAAQNGWLNIGF